MKKLRLYTAFLVAGLLIGCSSSESEGEGSTGDIISVDDSPSSSSSSGGAITIVNTPLPIQEDFGSYTDFDRGDTVDFFSGAYRALATNVPADASPSFYYPTCCFSPAMGDRIWITNVSNNPSLMLSNARLTIGQTLSEALANPVAPDMKITSTPGNATADTGSWGELDLSDPYKISFCVLYASGAGNFEIYVDNNSGGTSTASIHLAPSRIDQVPANTLVAGQRHSVLSDIGDEHSFLQLRASSGSAVLMDDLWIGYQSDTSMEPSGASCSVANSAVPPAVPTDLALTEGDTEIDVSWASSAFPFATSYDIAYNTTDSTAGATVINVSGTSTTLTGLTNNTEYFVFVRGKNGNGNSIYSASESATPAPPPVPPSPPTNLVLTPGNAQIGVSWTAGANATSYDVAYNTINDPDVADGATIVNTAATSTTITGLANGTEYFVFVWSKNSLGDSTSISDSVIPELPGVEDDRTWTGDPDMDELTYTSILVTTPPAGANNNVAAGTNTIVNGLAFFASTAGPLRHRSTADEFNFNGSSYTSDVATPAVGMAAPATRVYIGVPVEASRPVTISALHRNSSSGVTDNSVKIVFIGSDGNVLCIGNAASNSATTTQCALLVGHAQTEVRIIYSREGTGTGGQHLTTITRDYQDN